MAKNRRVDPIAATSLGEAAAIGRIEKALFGGDARLVHVGRYEVRELIGSGAFGKVYRAYDPQLDREVALKVLAGTAGADREALLTEARVMAALGHPNIVAVHDAGILDGDDGTRVFIAMELVDGANLNAWLERPRAEAEIVDASLQIGRGLAAAHAAGIVHRDLKPDNILVGRDGRVRVGDFGLARRAETDGREGRIEGSPAYMAPEQLAGRRATAASDQFAFCVTMWEALYTKRPFVGQSIEELRHAIDTAPVPPRGGRIARALVRGLSNDPEARFASIDDLLAAIAPRRARWLLPAVIAATAGIGISVGIAATRVPDAAVVDPCPLTTSALAGVWNDDFKQVMHRRFATSTSPLRDDTFVRATAALDRLASSYMQEQRAACRATHVEHVQSPELLDRRMSCLRGWRREVSTTVTWMMSATPDVMQHAVKSISALTPIERCADVDALAAGLRPTQIGDPIDELQSRLARLRLFRVDNPKDAVRALEMLEEIAADPLVAKHAPLAIAVAQWRANITTTLGRPDDARTAARSAFDLAVGISDRYAAATAAISIAFLGAYDTRRKADSLQWVATAQTVVDKLERASTFAVRLAMVEGNLHLINADARAALPVLERAVTLAADLGDRDPQVPSSLAMLGFAELAVGNLDGAEEHLLRAIVAGEAALGPLHPDVASIHSKFALVQAARGRYADATKSGDRAIEILQTVAGRDHATLLYVFGARGQHQAMRGQRDAAENDFAEAARIAKAALGPDHPLVGQIALERSALHARAGRGREAVELARGARDLVAKTADERDLGLALADATLARAIAVTGDRTAAIERARGAVSRCRALAHALPSGPCAIIHQVLGELAREPAEIEHELTAAATAIETGAPDPVRLAEIRFALARARHARDPDVARELARRAEREFPRDGDPQLRAAITAWLAQ